MYNVILSEQAKNFFEKANAQIQKKLDRCFQQLTITPDYHPNIKPLKGNLSGYYRYRVGDYRVVYFIDEQNKQVLINNIEHRKKIYK